MAGREQTWDLSAQSLAFTVCQVPVCYRLAETAGLTVEWHDGHKEAGASAELSREIITSIFNRTGKITRIVVNLPANN